MSGVYYNEIEPFKARWLRELIAQGLIAAGEVDERSITDIKPEELRGFTQCHFFAGIGAWSYALRLAGWDDDRPVWTGSCPCPSFSAAGKGKGFNDPRHLWPAWFGLIRECRPATVFGEQVDAAIGHGWLDLVQSDLEAEKYAVGKAVLGACSVGAPHIRKRLFFVAESHEQRAGRDTGALAAAPGAVESGQSEFGRLAFQAECGREVGSLADAEHAERRAEHIKQREAHGRDGLRGRGNAGGLGLNEGDGRDTRRAESEGQRGQSDAAEPGGTGYLGDAEQPGLEGHGRSGEQRSSAGRETSERHGATTGFTGGFWRDAEWLYCRDGKYRPVEPGVAPLVAGSPARVGRLRGYGDAICAQVAQAFIEAFMDTQDSSVIERVGLMEAE